MQNYVAFLRGVNISGHNLLNMTGLSVLFRDLGFSDAMTYIQSGNVIFRSSGNTGIPVMIEKAILKQFGLEVPVIIRTVDELVKLEDVNPYLKEENFNPGRMAVIFLKEAPSKTALGKVADLSYPPDKFLVDGDNIFIYCPDGFGRSKIQTNFFERKMNVTGTARNWKTIRSITELALKQS